MQQKLEKLDILKAHELYSCEDGLDSGRHRDTELLDERVVTDQAGRIAIRQSGGIDFVAPRHRVAVTLAMIRDFGPWAQPDASLEQVLEGRMGYRANFPILPIRFLDKLTRDQEDILLAEKEQAILQYMQLEAFPASPELAVIVDGIDAYYELFAHNLYLVDLLAWSSCRKVPYPDLYQEGAMQLLNAVLHIGLNYDRPVDFSTIAYRNIRKQKDRGIVPLYYDSMLPPGTFPYSQVQNLHNFNRNLEVIKEQEGKLPSVTQLSTRLNMGRDTVLGFMSVSQDMVSFDNPEQASDIEVENASLTSPDFAEELLSGINNRNITT